MIISHNIKKFYKTFKNYAILKKRYEKICLGQYSLFLNRENLNFWKKAEKGQWEPNTFHILDLFLSKKTNYCDIGAWIGPTVMYASQKCDQVICFEPDPIAYRLLTNNIHENGIQNVQTYNFAIASETGLRTMASLGNSAGDSMSSLVNPKKDIKGFKVASFGWNEVSSFFDFKTLDFIKIDIEGGEFDLIPAMKKYIENYKPTIYLSLHAPYLRESERLEGLEKIVEVLGVYNNYLNDNLEEVEIEELLSELTQKSFPSFLFKD